MKRWWLPGALALAGALGAEDLDARPSVGSARPPVQLSDAWGRSIDLARYRGRPLLLVYEDKDSAAQNAALKTDFATLAKGDRYQDRIAIVPVADVSAYDYWPVRGLVKDAIKDESRRQGLVIYCDWDGRVRSALGVTRSVSNVVLYGPDGRVAFAKEATLSADERRELVGLVRGMVD
jgi:hypothetical protein